MRSKIILLLAIPMTACAVPAFAQSTAPIATLGSIDFGARTMDASGDRARYQRFRDQGDGFFLDRVRYKRDAKDWRFDFSALHVGRLDQRYTAEYRRTSRLKVGFQWDQVPLFVSGDTRTPYTIESIGVFRLPDATQQAIQSGKLKLADLSSQAQAFDVRSRRDTGRFDLTYSLAADVDAKVSFTTSHRDGTMPWGTAFGHSNVVELAAPIDTRTTDLRAGLVWANGRGMLRVGYDGSWFDNRIQTLVWDNPLVLTPASNAPSEGQMALWPNNTLHTVTTMGALKLPFDSRIAADIAIGALSQNQALLPFTTNPAAAVLGPLPRTTADASARTLAMNYSFTSRPNRFVWLNARFRYYDFNNRTPVFAISQYSRLDGSPTTVRTGGTEPLGSLRQNVDLDASFTPTTFTAIRVGYGRDWTKRTYRIFERTTEDVGRMSVDTTQFGWLTLRAIVEQSVRKGHDFALAGLTVNNEQPLMRHFDIADRDRSRVTGLIQVAPRPEVAVSLSAAKGEDDYKNTGLGLRDNRNRTYAVTFDLTPVEQVAAGLFYTFERYDALQLSRTTSAATFTDVRRNWSLDSGDRVHTIGGTVDLLKVFPRTELRFSYDLTRSNTTYVYRLAADTTLATPAPLPAVTNQLVAGVLDARYFLSARLAVGLVYRYDRYAVEDFALSPTTLNDVAQPGSLYLAYLNRPYRVHSTWLRFTYLW